ncbi:hypothetical protein HanXRQr2_Chr08g0319751 [Helianthus annuus]|uniref:Uncharacterized protein n=1 Tax=Helianthus annuus TaxID=4232 RepID=A0A9K3NBI1_HELAN|nr:hypothetical protein HanXRQr2_Chr08g0319751 [Helianthus annuus]
MILNVFLYSYSSSKHSEQSSVSFALSLESPELLLLGTRSTLQLRLPCISNEIFVCAEFHHGVCLNEPKGT